MADERVSQVKQVKEACDIVDVIGSYVNLRPAGPKYKGLCPFHDDHRPSFDVDPKWQNYRCWSCGKSGDVFTFIQEIERVDFREALELLARRAGITLEKNGRAAPNSDRAAMLELTRWAADQFHRCLLDSPLAEAARRYLGERQLKGEIVRRFGLGYAPLAGDWLVQRAAAAGLPFDLLEKVGLVAQRTEGKGHYDRFRDRLIFPIRDARGQPVGFGGRVLPGSPLEARAPKYYNSADTPLFTKSEHLYGLDLARQAAAKDGCLVVVEGYTDVLMAHQVGIANVVATMGTALNGRHVQHLRRWVPRVVLVFDADAGGATGVDRALELFVSNELDLRIATLPEGLDPCDLLVQQGPEPFRSAIEQAVDPLEFKLSQVLAAEDSNSIEGRRRAVDGILGVIALAPELTGQAGAVKRELIISCLRDRLQVKEETLWARLKELRAARRSSEPATSPPAAPSLAERGAKADRLEADLLEILLADPALVPAAAAAIVVEEIRHPGLRQLLNGLYGLHAQGRTPELDALRPWIDNPYLASYALQMQARGQANPDRAGWLERVLREFRLRRLLPEKQLLQNQLHAANDHAEALELLRKLQNHAIGDSEQ